MLKGSHLAGEWVLRKAGREIPIRGPAILSAERMTQLQQALDSTAKVRPGNRVYPLTGRIFGACGVPFNGIYRNDRGHRNHRRYECRYNDPKFDGTDKRCYCRRVDADWLEATVWGAVSDVLSDPDRLIEMAQEYLDLRSGELREEATQIGNLDRRLAGAKRKRTNLALAAAITGPMPSRTPLPRSTATSRRLSRCGSRLARGRRPTPSVPRCCATCGSLPRLRMSDSTPRRWSACGRCSPRSTSECSS